MRLSRLSLAVAVACNGLTVQSRRALRSAPFIYWQLGLLKTHERLA